MRTDTAPAPMPSAAEGPPQTRHLRVTRATLDAERVVSLELVDPEAGDCPPWNPGAHLDLVLPSGTVRQYSLCGDAHDRSRYTVAVLYEPDGRGGSREIHETQLVGRTVQVRGPRNHFALEPAPRYLFIAGGIGITPILAMIREASRQGVPWRLVYGGRSLRSMAFCAEVTALAAGSHGSVALVPEDECGRPNLEGDIALAAAETAVYACGPEGLLQSVQRHCAAHLPDGALHLERFTAAPPATPTPGHPEPEDTTFEVELARTGQVLTVPPERSVLDAVQEIRPDVMSSCEEGFCGTCETRVLDGTPDHRDTILSRKERERSATMFICVSRALTPRITLDL